MSWETYIRQSFQRAVTAYSHSKNVWDNDPRKYFLLSEEEIRKVDKTYADTKYFLDHYSFRPNQAFELFERAKYLELVVTAATKKMNRFPALLVHMSPR